jgi:hypothetical protein
MVQKARSMTLAYQGIAPSSERVPSRLFEVAKAAARYRAQ